MIIMRDAQQETCTSAANAYFLQSVKARELRGKWCCRIPSCSPMKVSSCGLVFLAGATTVHGFVPHVMRTRVVRSFTGALASSAPVSRPYRPTADRCLLMGPKGDHLQHSTGGEERPTRQGRYPFGLHKVSGPGKLAAVGVLAAATTTQILPQAAVAAEAAIPIASAALDGSLVEMLTNSGFFQAFSLVFVSEIGDKTFFIAALLAAKTSRLISFVGSVGALAVMTVLAVLLGLAFHSVPTVFTSGLPLDDIIAAGAFLYFGINTLKDAYELPDNSNEGIEEEKAEAEESVKELKGKKTAW